MGFYSFRVSKFQGLGVEVKVAFYMNCVSAHQLPLAKEVAELVGPENFRYVDAGEKGQPYQSGEVLGLKFKVQSLKS